MCELMGRQLCQLPDALYLIEAHQHLDLCWVEILLLPPVEPLD